MPDFGGEHNYVEMVENKQEFIKTQEDGQKKLRFDIMPITLQYSMNIIYSPSAKFYFSSFLSPLKTRPF